VAFKEQLLIPKRWMADTSPDFRGATYDLVRSVISRLKSQTKHGEDTVSRLTADTSSDYRGAFHYLVQSYIHNSWKTWHIYGSIFSTRYLTLC